MFRIALTTTALTALLATGLQAQTTTAPGATGTGTGDVPPMSAPPESVMPQPGVGGAAEPGAETGGSATGAGGSATGAGGTMTGAGGTATGADGPATGAGGTAGGADGTAGAHGEGADSMTPSETSTAAGVMPPGEWTATELTSISTERLLGTDLVNFDNESLGTIDDVIISDTNSVEGVVVTFGGVLGFGEQRVLIQPDEIEVMQDANENLLVRTSLTPESIESRPAYEGS